MAAARKSARKPRKSVKALKKHEGRKVRRSR